LLTKENTGLFLIVSFSALLNHYSAAVVIPNAIAITTHRKEYIFRSFWDRDECFNIISNMLAKYKETPRESFDSERGRSDTLDVSQSAGNRNSVNSSDPAAYRAKSMTLTAGGPPPPPSGGTPHGDTELDSGWIAFENNIRSEMLHTFDNTDTGRRELDATAGTAVAAAPVANHAKDLADEIEKSKLKIQVVTEKMPLSVDDFEKKFVLENAPHGWLR
jgi:hypothetical protein